MFTKSLKAKYTSSESFSDNQLRKNTAELIKQHQLFTEKLIPEIELHLIELTANCQHQDRLVLLMCLKWMSDFGKELREHIQFEEEHIFSKKVNASFTEETLNFIHHHEDYELKLQKYLNQIKNSLSHLTADMSFRILILKLELLHEAMMAHAELEHNLFH